MSLFSIAVLYAASWLILVAGGVWVSAGLLVLFPIALQMGFVFIGGQAGRLLDVRQMKERFPRVVGGFSVGFLLGGLLAIPLLALLGSTEDLLLGTTVAQLAFVGLLLETERRFPEVRSAPIETSQETARPSARTLFASGLVLLLLVYQVLSAMGSWLVDYLLFNRANAHYSGDDLTRFLSWYTAVLNLADILFLALLAGPLLRRFGLRLGLVLNPAVVAALLAVMAVVVAGPGAAAYGLFVLAAVARLTDIVLTDGTTRTSVNASFQVVPIKDRLAVQAVVEGIGVPVAIGATGAVLLLMNLLGLGIGAVIVFGAVLSVIWTVSGAAMYRSYTRALADEMRRRSLVATRVRRRRGRRRAANPAQVRRRARRAPRPRPAARRRVRWLPPARSAQASEHADPEVRMRALVQLAAGGDAQAAAEATALATDLARSADPAERCAAASALGPRRIVTAGQSMLIGAPRRPGPDGPGGGARRRDARGRWTSRRSSVGWLQRSRSRAPRAARPSAVRRLGDSAVPLLASRARRATERRGARPWCVRRPMRRRSTGSRSSSPRSATPIVWSCSRHSTRWMRRTAPASYRRTSSTTCSDDASRARSPRSRRARGSLAASDGSLRRALEDESDLARRLVIAVLALRHGDRVRDAVRVVDAQTASVAHSESRRSTCSSPARRPRSPFRSFAATSHQTSRRQRCASRAVRARREEWIADLAEDPEGVWRSSWLALCARHAAAR